MAVIYNAGHRRARGDVRDAPADARRSSRPGWAPRPSRSSSPSATARSPAGPARPTRVLRPLRVPRRRRARRLRGRPRRAAWASGAACWRPCGAEAARRGIHKLTSRVFADNAASRAAHRAAGFTEVGVQRRHGLLDGAWKELRAGRAAARGGRRRRPSSDAPPASPTLRRDGSRPQPRPRSTSRSSAPAPGSARSRSRCWCSALTAVVQTAVYIALGQRRAARRPDPQRR